MTDTSKAAVDAIVRDLYDEMHTFDNEVADFIEALAAERDALQAQLSERVAVVKPLEWEQSPDGDGIIAQSILGFYQISEGEDIEGGPCSLLQNGGQRPQSPKHIRTVSKWPTTTI